MEIINNAYIIILAAGKAKKFKFKSRIRYYGYYRKTKNRPNFK